jgi:hypothetical protein
LWWKLSYHSLRHSYGTCSSGYMYQNSYEVQTRSRDISPCKCTHI